MESTKQQRILIVEDEQPLLNVIRDKLTRDGFEVVTARTVAQAMDYINEVDDIDLIWLDHYLEGSENGLDLVMALKHSGESEKEQIPIFLISNTSYPEKHQSYLALGVEKYYTKSNYTLSGIIKDVVDYLSEKKPKK
jgi:CheY-like chemotaxis protein